MKDVENRITGCDVMESYGSCFVKLGSKIKSVQKPKEFRTIACA